MEALLSFEPRGLSVVAYFTADLIDTRNIRQHFLM